MKASSSKHSRSKRVASPGIQTPPISTTGLLGKLAKFPSAYLLIAFLSIAVYAQTLTFGFSGLDDTEFLIPGILATNGIDIKEAFTTGALLKTPSEFYRPIQSLSLMLDASFSGPKGTAYHFSNTLYHILTCSAIFYLLVLLGSDRLLSLFLATVYAVHPFFVHAVAWVPARGDLLIALFGILSFILFIQYSRRRSVPFFLLHVAAFSLALFAKETALLMPIVFLIHYYLTHRQDSLRSKLTRVAPFLVTWAIVMSVYSWMRLVIVKVHLADTHFGAESFFDNVRTIPEFVGKFILPLHLSPMPDFTITNTVAGILACTGLLAAIVRFGHSRTQCVWFGVLWFLVFTLPSLSYRHELGGAAYNYLEHRAYLPSIGLLVVVAELLRQPFRRFTRVFLVISTLAILSAATYSFSYTQNYQDETTFLTRAIVSNPRSALAYYNRGVMAGYANRFDDAFRDYQTAIVLKPNYSEAYNNRGIIKWRRRQYREAFADYDAAYHYNPGNYEALQNRGYAKLFFNDREGGYADLKKAEEIERHASKQ